MAGARRAVCADRRGAHGVCRADFGEDQGLARHRGRSCFAAQPDGPGDWVRQEPGVRGADTPDTLVQFLPDVWKRDDAAEPLVPAE